jgi:hypothetical protein
MALYPRIRSTAVRTASSGTVRAAEVNARTSARFSPTMVSLVTTFSVPESAEHVTRHSGERCRARARRRPPALRTPSTPDARGGARGSRRRPSECGEWSAARVSAGAGFVNSALVGTGRRTYVVDSRQPSPMPSARRGQIDRSARKAGNDASSTGPFRVRKFTRSMRCDTAPSEAERALKV